MTTIAYLGNYLSPIAVGGVRGDVNERRPRNIGRTVTPHDLAIAVLTGWLLVDFVGLVGHIRIRPHFAQSVNGVPHIKART